MFDFMLVCLFVFVSKNHINGPNFFWFLKVINIVALHFENANWKILKGKLENLINFYF